MPAVQFNASTLKASYVAANNKAQTIKYACDDCENCTVGETPCRLLITFTGVSFCGCVTSLYRDWIDGDSGINDSYIIPQSSPACYWAKTFPASDNRAKTREYWNYDCDTGDIDAEYHGPVKIELYKNSAVTMILRASVDIIGGGWFFHTGELTPSDCVNSSGSQANLLVLGDCNSSGGGYWGNDPFGNSIGKVIGYGGSVTITELW